MERNSGIYIITAPNDRVYIGSSSSIGSRKRNHFYMLKKGIHHCDGLQNAYGKYGRAGLTFKIIEYCNSEELIEREQWWIDNHRLFWNRMYNSSKIAGRIEFNDAARKKMSDAKKGVKHSEEYKRNMSEVCTGKKLSEETKEKMRRAWTPERRKSHGEKFMARMTDRWTPEKREAQRMIGSISGKKGWTDQRRKEYSERLKARRLREHMARLNWIVGGIFEPIDVGTV